MPRTRAERGVSARTIELIERTQTHRDRLTRRSGLPELIRQVAQRGEPKSLLYLRELLLDRHRAVREAAAESSAHLLEAVSPHDWVWFDEVMRSGYLAGAIPYGGAWREMQPVRFTKLIAELPEVAAAVVIGTTHGNGFIREAALEASAALRVGRALPLIFLRLRDWVPEVRAAAWRAWSVLLERATQNEQLELLPLLSHLAALEPKKEVRRSKELRRGAEALSALIEAEGGATLLLGIEADDVATRRYCYAALLKRGIADPPQLFDSAVRDADPAIQEWAVELAQQSSDRRRLLRRAASMRRARVRLRALRALWELEGPGARDLLEAALLSYAMSVRDFAIWALRQLESFQPATYYRRAMRTATGRALAAAISELGRWGVQSDAEIVTLLLAGEYPSRVRSAALRAAYSLDPSVARRLYETGIMDGSRRVARTARDLLVTDRAYPVCQEARRWARGAAPEHSRLYSLTIVMRRCAKWKRLVYLLEIVLDDEEPVAPVARRALAEWVEKLNRSAVLPSKSERERALWLLARCEGTLPERVSGEIRFALR